MNSQILNIAIRQLSHRRRQTTLTVTGIGVGVMVLIAAVSLMDGLLQSFIDKIVNIAPHIIVSGERIRPVVRDTLWQVSDSDRINFIMNVERKDKEIIKNYSRIANLISSDINIEVATPVLSENVIAKFGTLSQPLEIFGVDPARQNKIVKFSENMITGNYSELSRTPNGIIVGTTAAKEFSLRRGDRLQIVSAGGNVFNVKVLGIFSTGINDIDNNAYLNLRLAQNIGGFSADEVTQLYLRVKDLPENAKTARAIENKTNYRAVTWEEAAASVIALYRMISMIVYFLVFFVILVAGFGVANVLITNVLEKYRDIAILKSIGFKKNEITLIYIIQGMLVAIIGAAAGCILGYLLIEMLGSIRTTPSESGSIRSDRLQMGMSAWYFVLASVFALIVSLFASIGPSRGASRINPVEILRGER